MTEQLTGKVAIVTGAAYGIGAAIARHFVGEGARVVLVDVAEPALRRLAEELGGDAAMMRCDVSNENHVEAAVDHATTTFGGLDIVVNNAAASSDRDLVDLKRTDWERVFSVSVGGVFHTVRHAAPVMRERGGGAFVNISSVASRHAMRGMSAYAAAKAGVEAITRCAALELREDGIRANAIAPGIIRTAAAKANLDTLSRAVGFELTDYVVNRQGRWGEPDEVARIAAHLASDETAFTSGQTYVLDNGASALL